MYMKPLKGQLGAPTASTALESDQCELRSLWEASWRMRGHEWNRCVWVEGRSRVLGMTINNDLNLLQGTPLSTSHSYQVGGSRAFSP